MRPIPRNPVPAGQSERTLRKKYARCAASHFLQRINQCPVAIWRQCLQNFKKRCSAQNDAAHEDGASRIGDAEKHANECKADDVFKMSIVYHCRLHQKRHQLEIYGVDEADMGQGSVSDYGDRCPRRYRDQVRNIVSAHDDQCSVKSLCGLFRALFGWTNSIKQIVVASRSTWILPLRDQSPEFNPR